MLRITSASQKIFSVNAHLLESLASQTRSLSGTFRYITNSPTTPDATPSQPSLKDQEKKSSKNNEYINNLVPKIVIFGGSGFVGTRACEQVIKMGADCISISRHGRPPSAKGAWADAVQWEKGDALDPQQPWKSHLNNAAGVISTLGTFGSNELMYRICGQANIDLIEAAAVANVPRFAFISVHDYQFPGGWHAQDFLLKGYFQGKRDAEAALQRVYPEGGVALRPGFIYGSRSAGNVTVPLGVVGVPLAAALKFLPSRSLASIPIVGAAFVPPVSVDTVGKAAASAVLDSSVESGPMDVWTIEKYSIP